jgi:hypothetical protein
MTDGSVMPEFDRRLEVLLATGEQAFIVGSCHTFPGRMSVTVPSDDRTRCISKSDVESCSDEARYWIMGFLHGSVPSPPEDAKDELIWIGQRARFLDTGDWTD